MKYKTNNVMTLVLQVLCAVLLLLVIAYMVSVLIEKEQARRGGEYISCSDFAETMWGDKGVIQSTGERDKYGYFVGESTILDDTRCSFT